MSDNPTSLTSNERAPLKSRPECDHATLSFGSGDYYIFCDHCGQRWAVMAIGQKEYGILNSGELVGASPESANQGPPPHGKRSAHETADDSARLEWLMRNISGAEFRRLSVLYGDFDGIRRAIDAAIGSSVETSVPSPRFAGLLGLPGAPKAGDKCQHCGNTWIQVPFGGQGVYHECHTGPSSVQNGSEHPSNK